MNTFHVFLWRGSDYVFSFMDDYDGSFPTLHDALDYIHADLTEQNDNWHEGASIVEMRGDTLLGVARIVWRRDEQTKENGYYISPEGGVSMGSPRYETPNEFYEAQQGLKLTHLAWTLLKQQAEQAGITKESLIEKLLREASK